MQAAFIRFREIEIDGTRYTKDVVISGGQVTPRDKAPSRPYAATYGHTPLSVKEAIPWNCKRLVIGSGVDGLLPVMPQVTERAQEQGVELVIISTPDACKLLSETDLSATNAILHLSC